MEHKLISRKDFEELGSKCKSYESAGMKVYDTNSYIMVRVDGRAFHTLTRKLEWPYDTGFANCMFEATIALVEEFNAMIGYTQSDEITIVIAPQPINGLPFGGRATKIETIAASIASVAFNHAMIKYLPRKFEEGARPVFDARSWSLVTLELVKENIEWRKHDATRNSISNLFCSKFGRGAGASDGLSSLDKLHKLNESSVDWSKMPEHFKHGVYFARVEMLVTLSKEDLEAIPEKHRPVGPILRHRVQEIPANDVFNSSYASSVSAGSS